VAGEDVVAFSDQDQEGHQGDDDPEGDRRDDAVDIDGRVEQDHGQADRLNGDGDDQQATGLVVNQQVLIVILAKEEVEQPAHCVLL
jgi:hypothetical protein